jgi:hypothetical protein
MPNYFDSSGVNVTPESLGIYNTNANPWNLMSDTPPASDFSLTGTGPTPTKYSLMDTDLGSAGAPGGADTAGMPAPDSAAQAAGTAGTGSTVAGAAIGAGLGLLQSIGQQNAYKNRALAAATQTRFSPWTRLGLGQMPNSPNALGSILGLGASGAAFGQALGGGNVTPLTKMYSPGSNTSNGS